MNQKPITHNAVFFALLVYLFIHSLYVCMYGWMDGWMDGRTDGWMDVCMHMVRGTIGIDKLVRHDHDGSGMIL